MADPAVAQRFPILFTGGNRAMSLIGIVPSSSWVEVDGAHVTVRLSWAFRLQAQRSAVVSVEADDGRVGGWGVHGWGGRWLVNGSASGLVRLTFREPQRGWVSGFPVRVRQLRVSMVDRDTLIAALSS